MGWNLKQGRQDSVAPLNTTDPPSRMDSSIELLDPTRDPSHCPHFQAKVPENGRLPQAALGASHVREVFTRMGFDDKETMALIGAHCVGRCHVDRSGYHGRKLPFLKRDPLSFRGM
jgi:hypothetical protein